MEDDSNSVEKLSEAKADDKLVELNSHLASVLITNDVVLVLYLIIGSLGNLTVIYFYVFKMKSKRTHRFFIPTLALLDLLACVVGSSFALAVNLLPVMFRGDYLCKALWYSCEATTLSSGLVLIAIAVERYLKVCKPFGHQMEIKWKKTAIVLSTIFSASFAIPVIEFYGEIRVENLKTNMTGYSCGRDPLDTSTRQGLVFYNFSLFAFALIAVIVLTVLYGFVGRAVYKQLKKEKERKKPSNLKIPRIEISELVSNKKNRDLKYSSEDWEYPSGTTTPSYSGSNSNVDLCHIAQHPQENTISNINCDMKKETDAAVSDELNDDIFDEKLKIPEENYGVGGAYLCENNINENLKSKESENGISNLKENLSNSFSSLSVLSKIVEPSHSVRESTIASCSTRSLSNLTDNDLEKADDGSLLRSTYFPFRDEAGKSFSALLVGDFSHPNKNAFEMPNNKDQKSQIKPLSLDLLSPKLKQKSKSDSNIGLARYEHNSLEIKSKVGQDKGRKPRLSIDMLKVPRIKSKHVRNHFSVYRYSYMFMIITVVFIISFTPRIWIMVQEALDPHYWRMMSDSEIAIHLFLYRMYIINHIANPFIYGSFDSAFRKKLWKCLCRRCDNRSFAKS